MLWRRGGHHKNLMETELVVNKRCLTNTQLNGPTKLTKCEAIHIVCHFDYLKQSH